MESFTAGNDSKKSKGASSSNTNMSDLKREDSNEYFMNEDTDDELQDLPSKSKHSNTPLRERMASAAEERIRRDLSSSSAASSTNMFDDSPELDQTPHMDQEHSEDGISWCGVPLNHFTRLSTTNPSSIPVRSAPDHTVLVKLPVDVENGPQPSADELTDIWSTDFVKMPCSPQNLYPHQNRLAERWSMITKALSDRFRDVSSLSSAIMSYNERYASKWNFAGLKYLIEEEFEEDERKYFFERVLPSMCKLALDLPTLITEPVPLLKQDRKYSLTLSQLQIGSLLANAFFCTFPRRNAKGKNTEYETYPDINFNRLFFHKTTRSIEKLKCIINYFRVIVSSNPLGVVTFTRQCIPNEDFPDWRSSSKAIPPLHIDSKGYIEDCQGLLQVDFANKRVGGGVLGLGCVQEEIRFVLCPELLVSRLFTEVLARNEALIVTGVQQYNTSEGYASTFKWTGPHDDQTPFDEWGRRLCEIVAMDALHFSRNPAAQYQPHLAIREIQKAYTGYKPLSERGSPAAVATGNWGCGAFKGDPKFKALLQLIACAEAGRDMAYFTFGDAKLRDELANIHVFLQDNEITAGKLLNVLIKYGALRRDGKDLVHFLYHHLSSSDSDTEMETPSSSCDMDEPTIEKSNPKQKDTENQKTAKTIKDYFKPSSSSTSTKAKSSKNNVTTLTGDQISEALKKCDEVVATHCNNSNTPTKKQTNKNKTDNGGGSRLLQALDELDKGPT